jgi:hypothetical protein
VIVVVGGCERVGGFNLPYTECYDPVTGEWKSLAKLPEFTKSEYAVCALRNDILVSGELLVCSLTVCHPKQQLVVMEYVIMKEIRKYTWEPSASIG